MSVTPLRLARRQPMRSIPRPNRLSVSSVFMHGEPLTTWVMTSSIPMRPDELLRSETRRRRSATKIIPDKKGPRTDSDKLDAPAYRWDDTSKRDASGAQRECDLPSIHVVDCLLNAATGETICLVRPLQTRDSGTGGFADRPVVRPCIRRRYARAFNARGSTGESRRLVFDEAHRFCSCVAVCEGELPGVPAHRSTPSVHCSRFSMGCALRFGPRSAG